MIEQPRHWAGPLLAQSRLGLKSVPDQGAVFTVSGSGGCPAPLRRRATIGAGLELIADEHSDTPGHRFLSTVFLSSSLLVTQLCNPRVFGREGELSSDMQLRRLELLAEISIGSRVLGVLSRLLRDPDANIRP